MNKIESIKIQIVYDEYPDTSFLGEYSDTWKLGSGQIIQKGEHAGEFADEVDAEEHPEKGREYRYFTPYAGGEEPGAENFKKYALEDFERMESLNNGLWNFCGIFAKATINVKGQIQIIQSSGLWGIESDSGRDYFREIAEDQLNELKDQLKSLNCGMKAFPVLAKNALERIED